MSKQRQITFAPRLDAALRPRLCELARQLSPGADASPCADGEQAMLTLTNGLGLREQPALRAAGAVLVDLARQGYEIISDGEQIVLRAPAERAPQAEKERKRQQLYVERDAQLRQQSARSFVEKMGSPRRGLTPISALMRDGEELSALVSARLAAGESLVGEGGVIDPYLQIIQGAERCELTGHALKDIWRYFRYTWANAPKSVPGRTMMILVRDRAAPAHPVIGIAALSSAAVQIRERDLWIGWHPDRAQDGADLAPPEALASWAQRVVDDALGAVYTQDLEEAGILTSAQLRDPQPELLEALLLAGQEARREHQESGSGGAAAADWEAQARTPLFRSKRALLLADLLEQRAALRRAWGDAPSAAGAQRLLESPDGARTLRRILRKAKADRVGLHLADISVCGALPPYNELLGGKLVCALLMSPEVREAWRARYEGAESIIASSMAGRAVSRPAELVLLTTTSLFGRSSQYNRLKLPCSAVDPEASGVMRYERLGMSEGYGTDQFSALTVEALDALTKQERGFQRVNSVFGEGVNPRMRKIREGLELLGLPSDELLIHGNQRELYGVPLAANFRDYLIGLAAEPSYLLSAAAPEPSTARVAAWWGERWLTPRAGRPEILERVAAHRGEDHGAKVHLPEIAQRSLF